MIKMEQRQTKDNSDKTPLLHDGPSGFIYSDEEEFTAIDQLPEPYETEDDLDESETEYEIDTGDRTHIPKSQKSSPRTPCFVYLLTMVSAIGGFLFGYDTGVVSGAMLLMKDEFHFDSLWHELIVSVTIGAAAIFALVGGYLNNRLGRKPIILVASLIFASGALILAFSINKAMLLSGRIILGIAIGLSSMTVPMYIAESSPHLLRGRLVTLNNIFITGGQFMASLVDGAFSYDKVNGWRFMLGLAAIPAVLQFLGFLFMPESPRWLISKGRDEKARVVLQRIRGISDVQDELVNIKSSCEQGQCTDKKGLVIIRMLKIGHVRKALFVGCMLQLFQQIVGINTVMYYSATIIKMSGVKQQSAAIWLAAVTAGVNFTFTFLGLYLVEKIGRKPLTLISLAGTALSLAWLAISFHLAVLHSPLVTYDEPSPFNISDSCSNYNICNDCMVDTDCGFCYLDTTSGAQNGSCLPVKYNEYHEPLPDASVYGRCNSTKLPDTVSWAYDFCPTDVAWMATFGLILYLMFFAPGMGPMPWTINSEIYPLWARSTGNAVATTVNWTTNLLISMTFLTLTEVLTRSGAFWLYTGFAVIGVISMTIILPETKGKNLEEVEEVFKKPWCASKTSNEMAGL